MPIITQLFAVVRGLWMLCAGALGALCGGFLGPDGAGCTRLVHLPSQFAPPISTTRCRTSRKRYDVQDEKMFEWGFTVMRSRACVHACVRVMCGARVGQPQLMYLWSL